MCLGNVFSDPHAGYQAAARAQQNAFLASSAQQRFAADAAVLFRNCRPFSWPPKSDGHYDRILKDGLNRAGAAAAREAVRRLEIENAVLRAQLDVLAPEKPAAGDPWILTEGPKHLLGAECLEALP